MATTVDDEVVPPLVPNEMLAGRGDASCLPRKLGNDAAEGGELAKGSGRAGGPVRA
jgi:hypothetical protein